MINDYMDELTHDATNDISEQSFVGTAGTAINGAKVKDGGAAGDWGAGCDFDAYVRITEALVGATGGVTFAIVTSAAATLTTPTTLATTTIAAASLTINSLHYIGKIKSGTRLRYLGLLMTPLSTDSTAGKAIVALKPCGAGPQNRVNSL